MTPCAHYLLLLDRQPNVCGMPFAKATSACLRKPRPTTISPRGTWESVVVTISKIPPGSDEPRGIAVGFAITKADWSNTTHRGGGTRAVRPSRTVLAAQR